MKIIYMGTPEFAVKPLEKLYEEGFDIPLVVSQKDRPKGRGKKLLPTAVKARAEELGLEVFQPDNINSEDSINKLKDIKPDFIVVAAYGQILRKKILSIPKYACINIHASLLPKYRGAAPINWAIIDGEEETGITIMEMVEKLDAGDIYIKESINIKEDDDAITIHDSLSELGGKTIVKALKGIISGKITPESQDDSKSNYAPMLNKKMGKIDWNESGESIKNLVRGLKPWPTAYTFYEKNNVKIHRVELCSKFKEGENGEIVKVDNEGIFVNSKDSCIIIKELQFPGKRKMRVEDFIKGNEIKVGTILE
ncbi:methionyl-tRNA formyltransferase [Anaerosalibacter massiliensis]|uniref:Methionyl-tRNA formyltransferase n=1 Tax=Anaerosalibacter massiliensis TaxID=1347392 RepID=A0A9X2S3C7_9FIRM|nr:methionyl-tRNA formyltransferase [Anaerosalibacter massiliensis]MCR2042570.1 methionyl-tRNA formyltransferase [Anaerosalibacter massiliensis]